MPPAVPAGTKAGREAGRHHRHAVRAAQIRPLDVGLETDHERADLVVVADLAAADEAVAVVIPERHHAAGARRRHEGARRHEHRAAAVAVLPAVAGVHAHIKPGPGEHRKAESLVEVFDATTGEVAGAVAVVKGPDQVTFTDRYAYVRGTGSEKFSLIELAGILNGKFTAVDVIAGQKPPSVLPAEIGVADMIAPTPEGNAAMIANTPDQMIYYYVEGMMAPMGTFSNNKRRPHALLILNRSLAEIAPGLYSVPVRLKSPGRFDVSVLTNQPRIVHCFQLEVAPSPDGEVTPVGSLVAKAVFDGQQFQSGVAVPLRFKISDPVTKQPLKGLTDVQVLAFEPPGIWQQRQWAKEVGEGEYEVSQTFPHTGQYKIMLRVASRGVNYADLPFASVSVIDK